MSSWVFFVGIFSILVCFARGISTEAGIVEKQVVTENKEGLNGGTKVTTVEKGDATGNKEGSAESKKVTPAEEGALAGEKGVIVAEGLNGEDEENDSWNSESKFSFSEFLQESISEIENAAKPNNLLPTIDDFQIDLNEADVTLVKKTADETVQVKFNVNESLMMEDGTDLISWPDFDVGITKRDTTLLFQCSFVEFPLGTDTDASLEEYVSDGEADGDTPDSVKTKLKRMTRIYDASDFYIDAIRIYKGEEANEKAYSVSGKALNEDTYDFFEKYLESKGVNRAFTHKMSVFSTNYENDVLYLQFLKKLTHFAS